MERMKKAISLLLVVAMLLTNCPVTAFASDADVLESGAFRYEVLEDGTLSICGYTGEPEDGLLHLEIPETLADAAVTQISGHAFEKTAVATIAIPASIRRVEDEAFAHCETLKAIAFCGPMPEMGKHLIEGCSSLEGVYLLAEEDATAQHAVLAAAGLTDIYLWKQEDLESLEAAFGEYKNDLDAVAAASEAGAVAETTEETIPETVSETTAETIPETVPETTVETISEETEPVTETWPEKIIQTLEVTVSQPASTGTGETTGFTYSVLNETQCAITGYTGTDTEIVIPAEIDGYQVHTIQSNAFKGKTALTSVTLPEGLKRIESYAFQDCTSLTYIDLPDSITEMANLAFRNCTALAEIGYPAGWTTTLTYANNTSYGDASGYYGTPFTGCNALKTITVDKGVTAIPKHAFRGMSSLEEIILPDSIESLGNRSFLGCTSLKKINLGSKMTTLPGWVFEDCTSLEEITLPESLTSISEYAFLNCSGLKHVTVPSGVTTIVAYTFSGCTSLASVTLPDGLNRIEAYAFQDCKALTYIDLPDSITEMANLAFRNCTALAEIGYPAGWTTTLTTYNNTSYGDAAGYYGTPFTGCTALKTITVDEGVTAIPKHAFRGMSSLEEIILPDSIESLGNRSFLGCTSLKKINLGSKMTTLEERVFEGCTSLEEITLPEILTSISAAAFLNCSSLKSITIPSGVTTIVSDTFSGCTSLASVTLPDGLNRIEAYAFQDCKALTYLDLPDSITEMAKDAFYNCTALAEIGYPAGWTTTLTTYNNTSYGDAAGYYGTPFTGCTALKTITVGEGVTAIPKHAFKGMTSLETIHLPESLTTIGVYAFAGCTGLKAIEIPRSVTTINANSLEKCSSDLTIYCYNASAVHTTFENSGYTLYFLDEHDHVFSTEVQKAPTCAENGSTKTTCAICGYYYIEVQKAQGHSFGPWKMAQDSGCETGGSQYRVCSVCETEQTRDLPANGHDYEDTVVLPTCSAQGRTVHICKVCGESYADAYVDPLQHSFGDWSTITEATVLACGVRTRVCSVCGVEATEEIPKVSINVEENQNYGMANFLVMDAVNLVPVSGASIFIATENDGEITLITDGEGKVSHVLPVGKWKASVCADGYIVRNITITVEPGVQDMPIIGISDRPMVDAKITVEEMTYEEMIAAGIDVGAKDNRHYYKWKCEIRFHEELYIPLDPVYKDSEGKSYTAPDPSPKTRNVYALSHEGTAVSKEHVTVYSSKEHGTYIKHRSSYENAIWTPEMGETIAFRNNGYYFEGYGLPSELTMTTQRAFPDIGWTQQAGTLAMKVGTRTHYLTYQEEEFRTVSSTKEVKSISLFEQVKVENDNYPTTAEYVYVPVSEPKEGGKYLLVQFDEAQTKKRDALSHEEDLVADVRMRIHRDDVLGEYITVEEAYRNAYWTTSYAQNEGLRILNNQYFGFSGEGLTFDPVPDADGWTLEEDGRLSTINSEGETVYLLYTGDYSVTKSKSIASSVTLYQKTTVQDLVDGSGKLEEKTIYRFADTFQEGEEYVIFGGSIGNGGGGGSSLPDGGGLPHPDGGHNPVRRGEGGGFNMPVIHQITEQYYLIIYGEVSWLKEMFEVELLVLNNSGLDPIKDCTAYLTLPEGLSLATMVEGQQSMVQTVDQIPTGGQHSFRWYIRGDVAGAYNIGATLTGMLGELESFSYYYETKDPIQVLAGNALKLTFKIPDVAYKTEPYVVTVELENVSDKVLYNVDHMITGWEQGKVRIYEDGKEEIVEVYGSGGYMGNAGVHAFYPGDKLVVELSFEILFESSIIQQMLKDLERIEIVYNMFEFVMTLYKLTTGISGFVSTASDALDKIIKAGSVTDALKLKTMADLFSALKDLYEVVEKSDAEALELANSIQSSDFYKELSACTSQEELEAFFLAQEDSKLQGIIDAIRSVLEDDGEEDNSQEFDAFDSIRTLIRNLPIRYVVDSVWVETMEGSTTVIPHEIKMVPGGQVPKMGVESWGKYIYNVLIGAIGKIETPIYAQLAGIPDDLTGYEDAVAYVKQTEEQMAAYTAHKSAYTNFSAWVERADGTIAPPDVYKVATENTTASYDEEGKLNFTGNAIVEVTAMSQNAAARSVGYDVLHIRDNDTGEERKIAIEVLPAHTCHSDVWTVDLAPTATNDGFRSKLCDTCGDIIAMETLTACTNHDFGAWITEKEATTDLMGIQYRECRNCCARETEFLPKLPAEQRIALDAEGFRGQNTVWIDGEAYAVQTDEDGRYVIVPNGNARTLVTYTYNASDAVSNLHRYPIGMQVWMLEYENGAYAVTRQEAFDDILQYSGMSIRVTGKKGIRMITSIEKDKKKALVSGGLEGYTLKEYGTVVAWASQVDESNPLVLGKPYAKSNYAYKKGVADPVFAYDGDLMQYTNVLVNFSDEQCKNELALRPYMILKDADGKTLTIYGGILYRSIGYIAYQNRDIFEPQTAEYNYIWDIIHYVYGDVYDDDFIHAWTPPNL